MKNTLLIIATIFVSSSALSTEYKTTVKSDRYNSCAVLLDQRLTNALMDIDLRFLNEGNSDGEQAKVLAKALMKFVNNVFERNPETFTFKKKMRSCCFGKWCPKFISDFFQSYAQDSLAYAAMTPLIEMVLLSKDPILGPTGKEAYSTKEKKKKFEKFKSFVESDAFFPALVEATM